MTYSVPGILYGLERLALVETNETVMETGGLLKRSRKRFDELRALWRGKEREEFEQNDTIPRLEARRKTLAVRQVLAGIERLVAAATGGGRTRLEAERRERERIVALVEDLDTSSENVLIRNGERQALTPAATAPALEEAAKGLSDHIHGANAVALGDNERQHAGRLASLGRERSGINRAVERLKKARRFERVFSFVKAVILPAWGFAAALAAPVTGAFAAGRLFLAPLIERLGANFLDLVTELPALRQNRIAEDNLAAARREREAQAITDRRAGAERDADRPASRDTELLRLVEEGLRGG